MLMAYLAAAMLFGAQTDDRLSDAAVAARLVDALKDPDLEVRLALGQALTKVSGVAVGPLTVALKDPLPARRAGAAYALGLIGDRANDALPNLLDALNDPELEVRRQAALAVGRVLSARPARVVPRPQAVRR